MDDLVLRRMPHSLEAESAVLGAMLLDSRCVSDILGKKLQPDDFYLEANRNIYDTIVSMFNYAQPIDAVTVLEQMHQNGTSTEGTARYLAELVSLTPTTTNAVQYAEIVSDKSLLRAIAETSDEITGLVHTGGSAGDVLELAEQKIFALRQGQLRGGLLPVSQILQKAYQRIHEAAKRDNAISGLPTGLPDLDRAIMGLNESDLIVLASRPGMGKTSIALNIAMHVAKSADKAVAIFSLEMSGEQLGLRLFSGESYIDATRLKSGHLSQQEWTKLKDAAVAISRTNLFINDNPALTVSDMLAQCRRVKDLGLVVVDYLQLLTASGFSGAASNQNRIQIVSDISRFFKIMAKELNVPVIVLSQLSRAVESRGGDKGDKRPMLSDLRESGAIEQDADVVLALYREGYYNKECENPAAAECIVLKNRHGDTKTVHLQWVAEYTTYTSVERWHDDEEN